MATKRSGGILLFRRSGLHGADCKSRRRGSGDDRSRRQQFTIDALLAHMGGPLWARRETGAWSIPKGEIDADEDAAAAAAREFTEELGLPVPDGDWLDLGQVTQRGGKVVTAWAIEADLDPSAVVPGTFEMEWPRGSGRMQAFGEIDRVAWFGVDRARPVIVQAQQQFLDRLGELLG